MVSLESVRTADEIHLILRERDAIKFELTTRKTERNEPVEKYRPRDDGIGR